MANVVSIIIRGVDQTAKGFNTPITNLASLKKAADAAATAFIGIGTVAVGALAALTGAAIANADDMGKMAQAAGMPVEEFSRLAFAAKLAGVETDKLKTGFNAFNKVLVEAAENPLSQGRQALDAMGVAITGTDGKLRASREILLDLADKFAGYEDSAEKSALAAQLFGAKAGPELLPLLNTGRQGIIDVGNESEAVTKQMAADAETFNDNGERLKRGLTDIGTQIAKELLPHLAEFSTWLVKLQKESGIFTGTAKTTVDVLKWLAVVAHGAATYFQTLGKIMGAVSAVLTEGIINRVKAVIQIFKTWFDAIKAIGDSLGSLIGRIGGVGEAMAKIMDGDFKGAWATAKQSANGFAEDMVKIGATIGGAVVDSGKVVVDVFKADFANLSTVGKQTAGDIMKEWEKLATFKDSLLGDTKGSSKSDKPTTKKGRAPTQGEDAPAWLIKEQEAIEQALEMERMFTEELMGIKAERAGLDDEDSARRMEQLALEYETKRLAAENEYLEHLERIGRMRLDEENYYALTTQAAEVKAQKLRKLDEEQQKREKQVNQTRFDSVRNMFGLMADSAAAYGKEGIGIWKAMSAAQTIMDTYSGAMAAYKSLAGIPYVGPALGAAAAAAVVAMGAANLSKINSTSFGQAHAGLTSVPQDATYMLKANERVLAPDQNRDFTSWMDGQNKGGTGGGMQEARFYLDGTEFGRWFYQASKDGKIQIHSNAIVET